MQVNQQTESSLLRQHKAQCPQAAGQWLSSWPRLASDVARLRLIQGGTLPLTESWDCIGTLQGSGPVTCPVFVVYLQQLTAESNVEGQGVLQREGEWPCVVRGRINSCLKDSVSAGRFQRKIWNSPAEPKRRQKTQGDLPVVESPFRLAFYCTNPTKQHCCECFQKTLTSS